MESKLTTLEVNETDGIANKGRLSRDPPERMVQKRNGCNISTHMAGLLVPGTSRCLNQAWRFRMPEFSIIFINNNHLIILPIMMPFPTLPRSSYRATPRTTLSISPLPGPFHMLFLARLNLRPFDPDPNGFAIIYHPLFNTNTIILNLPL
jgi:hypothetical protein